MVEDSYKLKLTAILGAYVKGCSRLMDGRGFGMVYRGPEDAFEFMKADDAAFGKVMEAAGLTK